MADDRSLRILRTCLEQCIELGQRKMKQIPHRDAQLKQNSRDSRLVNTVSDINVHSFSLDRNEEKLMKEITKEFETILKKNLDSLSKNCRKYFVDLLHDNNYHSKKKRFKTPFNAGSLSPFLDDLKELLASLDGFDAAWRGDIAAVKKFIETFPDAKNKTGVWGTTLLYSAARNNHLDIVKYLIRKARCSVNAQNQQHIKRAMKTKITADDDFEANPSAGSTALHGACYYGYLRVVQYLLEQGADYFITNHAEETPIHNAREDSIKNYFREILVAGYSDFSRELPTKPILGGMDNCVVDCVWEYASIAKDTWEKFSDEESSALQKSLIVKGKEKFKREIHLRERGDVYRVSLIEFLRSGKNKDAEENMAWVRCRGSSIANFDCYGLWQVMFTKHPSAISEASLSILGFPILYDHQFKLRLKSWYFCDASIDSKLDEAMRYRRKSVKLEMEGIQELDLLFDLQTFTFTNEKKTISGFIRWIPKMITNDKRNPDKIIGIDEFQSLAQMDIIPLTTGKLKEIARKKEVSAMDTDDNFDEDEVDDILSDDENERSDDSSDQTSDDIQNRPSLDQNDPSIDSEHDDDDDDAHSDSRSIMSEVDSADMINQDAADLRCTIQRSVEGQAKTSIDPEMVNSLKKKLSDLEFEKDELQENLELERARLLSLEETDAKQISDQKQQLNQLEQKLKNLEKQRAENEKKQILLQKMAADIKTIEYNNIQGEVVQNILTARLAIVLAYLRDNGKAVDNFFVDRVPRIWFQEKQDQYIVTVVGFEEHQKQFKNMLQRIWSLLNVVQSAKDFYQRHLNQTKAKLIKESLSLVKPKTANWTEYINLFTKLFEQKIVEYKKDFDIYMENYSRSVIDECILNKFDKPWIPLRKETDKFLGKNRLLDTISALKQTALEQFIHENIALQRASLTVKPTVASVKVLDNLLNKVVRDFKTAPQYQGHDLKHFSLIPKLLQRLMLYHSAFKIQLPLFESSIDLLDKIEKHVFTTISTTTGSGKSTLLPALLVAEGYDKVIVTQPRRLPCQLICNRVNETMKSEIKPRGDKLAGWAVSGTERNPQAKVLYLTDGLLKERLLYDENIITSYTGVDKSVVFFIDEVHERSVNIDLCLALLARLITMKPELKSKMKVIISSATLDTSVPDLFRQIPRAGLAEFKMPTMGTLYPVTKFHRPNENVLDIVQELCKKRKRHEQILCFVSSVGEVLEACRLINEISRETIVAYPLMQAQLPLQQREYIEHGTIFFSTTIAETSLTFPCLKYVIDTGMINTPVYDFESKRTILKEVRAAESNIKQRLGRLGRTQPGEYYSLYNFNVEDLRYPIPQICQSDLMNIEFSLRKSPLRNGFDYIKQFLPDKPSSNALTMTIGQLVQLGIVDKSKHEQLTVHGQALAKLPDFGSLAMSKAVLAALCEYDCGHDLICVASILGVLNTTAIFKTMPQHLKSADGDFMTLLNIMNEILLIRQSSSPQQFDLDQVCRAKGLTSIQHILRQALRRYTTLEKTFKTIPEYRERAQKQSGKWEAIARSLLAGYSDNVFVSMKQLNGRTHDYIRYDGRGDVAILDLQSTLTRPISTAPVALVLARDIRHSTTIRVKAILSFVGEIKCEWMEHPTDREFDVTDEEKTYLSKDNKYASAVSKFSHKIKMELDKKKVSLRGLAGSVLSAELHLRQEMVYEHEFSLTDLLGSTKPHENFGHNLESVMKKTYIFNPMKWRWLAQKQVEITVNADTAKQTCKIMVKAKDSDYLAVRKEFYMFVYWLQQCAVIREPNDGVSPRVVHPQMRKNCQEMEDRIARITDSKRTPVDLHNSTAGVKATRETRMEVVAWIAVCLYKCKVEGGFIRDWVVGNYTARPAGLENNPKAWIEGGSGGGLPALKKEVVPCDLDCHLPSDAYFDIEKFRDDLYKYDIHCDVYRDGWRYVLLIDKDTKTGPFTMDLIEPHVALTHDRIDFDVNNLYVQKDYTHELGMRIDIQRKPYGIELETVIDNILKKRFHVLRPIDKYVKERMAKMINIRGWTHSGEEFSVIPDPHAKHNAVLVPLPKESLLYAEVTKKMQAIPSVKIISIEEIKNSVLEETYIGMKKLIKKQCPQANPNERELFHGTKKEGIVGIVEDGFDDRFFVSSGLYGHGAYFADDPAKSHGYTEPDPTTQRRVMFYTKVTLGIPSVYQKSDQKLVCAPIGHHSVIGKHNPQYTEYIVYRYGQALPYLKIVYSV